MPSFETFSFANAALSSQQPRISQAPSTVFVDVSAESTRAEVTRGGFNIGEIAVRPDVIGELLDTRPVVQTKVVSQTIAPGTAVARGTAVDLVLTRTDDLPLTVIPGIHQFFQTATMASVVDQFGSNATVRDIVKRRTDVSQLTADEQTSLTNALSQSGVQVGTSSNDNLGAAFTALQAAFTFQG